MTGSRDSLPSAVPEDDGVVLPRDKTSWWMRQLAGSRRRLLVNALVASAAALLWGYWAAPYLEESSTSHTVNILVMVGQSALWLLGGWCLAAWLGTRLWGDVWRRRVLLGERTQDVLDEEPGDGIGTESVFRDRNGLLWAMAVVAALGLVGGTLGLHGYYFGEYNQSGYYRVMLRHPDKAQRIRGLRAMVDPLQQRAGMQPTVRAAVVGALDDPDEEVRMWAAWAAGHRLYVEARPGIVPLLESNDDETFIEAALALGRLADVAGERMLLQTLPDVFANERRGAAVLTGLGLMGSRESATRLASHLDRIPDALWPQAMWAIARARTTQVRDAILPQIDVGDLARRCATAEALKQVTTSADYDEMRRRYRVTAREENCIGARAPDRRYREDEAVDDFVYVPAEPLRRKYLIAAFNIGGPGLEDWLESIMWDESEEIGIRVFAENLQKALKNAPARLPRQ